MVVWLSVPTSVSGKATAFAVLLLGPHRLRQIFEIDLMADAGAGRHHAEIVEGAGAPAQERVALAVPLIFLLDIDVEGAVAMPKASTITEWSMTRSTGTSGLILRGSPPSARMASRMAARSTTAGTPVKSCISTRAGRKAISRSLLRVLQPVRHAANVVGGDGAAVLVTQQIFEQHLQRERQAGRCRRARSPRPPSGRNSHSCACRPSAFAGN